MIFGILQLIMKTIGNEAINLDEFIKIEEKANRKKIVGFLKESSDNGISTYKIKSTNLTAYDFLIDLCK